MRIAPLLSMLLFMAAGAHAGRLELTNGAVIPGELKRVLDGQLVWRAELIGDIKVDQASIATLDSTSAHRLRVGTEDLPKRCALSARGSAVTVSCPGRAALTTRWDDISRAGRAREGSGKVTTALTYERGNSYSDEFEIDAAAQWRYANLRHNLDGSVDYEENKTGRTEDEASLDYQLDYVFPSDRYVYARAKYSRDRFATLQEGAILGFGLGRTWTLSSRLKALLQAGPDYGRFDIQDIGRVREAGGNLQWRIDYTLALWRRDVTLFHEGNYGWVIRDSDLSRLESKSGIELPLTSGLIAELRLDYDRIGVNIPTIDDTDIEWVFALGYRW